MEFLVSAGQSKDVILLLEVLGARLARACLVTQITNCLSLPGPREGKKCCDCSRSVGLITRHKARQSWGALSDRSRTLKREERGEKRGDLSHLTLFTVNCKLWAGAGALPA